MERHDRLRPEWTRQIEEVDMKARRRNSVPLTRITREETLNIELTVDLLILMIKRCELPI